MCFMAPSKFLHLSLPPCSGLIQFYEPKRLCPFGKLNDIPTETVSSSVFSHVLWSNQMVGNVPEPALVHTAVVLFLLFPQKECTSCLPVEILLIL